MSCMTCGSEEPPLKLTGHTTLCLLCKYSVKYTANILFVNTFVLYTNFYVIFLTIRTILSVLSAKLHLLLINFTRRVIFTTVQC